jgi:membrane fusion protein, multidrug efflux system
VRKPIVVPIAVAAALAAACASHPAPRSARVAVAIATVERRAMPIEIAATGTVEPINSVDVTSQVNGMLQRVRFTEGADVTAGQVLFEIDPRPFRAAVQAAEANLARDAAQATAAALDAERYRTLVRDASVTQSDYQQKQAAADALAAAVRADSAALTTARLNLEYATITAPISGRTGSLLVHEGNQVRTSGSTPLVTIYQLRPILVRFAIPAIRLPDLQRRAGRALRVLARPSHAVTPVEGELSFVDNHVDSTTGTVLLKARYGNADRTLWPGEFVDVTLVLDVESDAVVVPSQAVLASQQGTYVFIVHPDSTVEQRSVTVDRTIDTLSVIREGLTPGMVVVTDGQLRLVPSARVEVRAGPKADSVVAQ